MTTFFIADLHLSESRPDISATFSRFIEQHRARMQALYVLGDLFEAWIGDDDACSFNQQIIKQFKQLTASGIPVYFVHGNRDFLIGARFAQQTGIQLLAEETVIDLYGQRVLLMHGDSLCTDDHAYQKFRRRSRSWWWQKLVLALPLSIRRRIAANARQKSASQNADKPDYIMDVNEQQVQSRMAANCVNILIHGHTHRPAIHQYTGNKRIVLGDWYEQDSWLEVSSDKMQLLSSS